MKINHQLIVTSWNINKLANGDELRDARAFVCTCGMTLVVPINQENWVRHIQAYEYKYENKS